MSTENRIFAEGKVKLFTETVSVGASNFKKRDIVITTDEKYPQDISFQFVQDKCDILNNYKVGDVVEIDFNIRGREWVNPQGESLYFNTLQGWKINKSITTAQAPTSEAEPDDLPY